MPHISILDPKAAHNVDIQNWVVAILRKPEGKNPEHVFLMVEGEGPENQVILKRYDLAVTKEYDAKNPYFSKFQIFCEDKIGPFSRAEESLIELLRPGETAGLSWRILKSGAEELHGNVLASNNSPEKYNLFGSVSMIPLVRESCHKIGGSVAEESIRQTVSHLPNGLQFQKVPGGGHCLFHAVGLYLGQDASFLRRIVSAHMEHNFEQFQDFYDGSEEQFRRHIQAIAQGSEWGAHIEIAAIQRVTNRPIIIIQPELPPIIPDNIDAYQNAPIFIYYNQHNHYDAFVLQDGADAWAILEEIRRRLVQNLPVNYQLIQFGEDSLTEASSHAITDSAEGSPFQACAKTALVAKPGHTCFTWARWQLLQLGYPEIEVDLRMQISDWISSPTSRYLKHPNTNPEPESKMCLIM